MHLRHMLPLLRASAASLWARAASGDADGFLRSVSGVVHVGANSGQERYQYALLGLDVLWVEPIPEVYSRLCSNIRGLRGQHACCALVTDVDGQSLEFRVSSNDGASSSIYDLKQSLQLWPHVRYVSSVRLDSVTLPTLFRRHGLDADRYQALVLDTQGSELLILRGAESMIDRFRYIKVEVADFESYAGCCQLPDIASFMEQHRFIEVHRVPFAQREGVGTYYDIVFRRQL